MDANTAKIATIILIGALMIIYVTVGGMKGTTYVQIVKAFMLMGGALLMTVLVLWHYGFNLSSLLGDAAAKSGKGDALPGTGPPLRQGGGRQRPADVLQQDRPALARHRAGARHGRPAAHPHPLLHRADRPRGPAQRAVGHRHHRHVLPVHAGARASARPPSSAARRSGSRTRAATRPHPSSRRRWASSSSAATWAARRSWR